MAGLSQDLREHLAYKWYCELLGRKPKTEERQARATEIDKRGVTYVYAAIYESKEGHDFRVRMGIEDK